MFHYSYVDTIDRNVSCPTVVPVKHVIQTAKAKRTEITHTTHDDVIHTTNVTAKGLQMKIAQVVQFLIG